MLPLDQISIKQQHPLPFKDEYLSVTRILGRVLVTAEQNATILDVHHGAQGVRIRTTNATYQLALEYDEQLHIRTGSGDDVVRVTSTQENLVVIETGAGDDLVRVRNAARRPASGSVVVDSGPGNDSVNITGQQLATTYARSGDDKLRVAAEYSVCYMGPGDDQLSVRSGQAAIHAPDGHNKIRSGPGADRLYGIGKSTLEGDSQSDRKFEPNHAAFQAPGHRALKIVGTPVFFERVLENLLLLASSPTASALLEALDRSGATITIENYPLLDNALYVADLSAGDPTIRDGRPGTPSLSATLYFNPLAQDGETHTPPVVMLYHELCHAWNFVTGTVMEDHERQAIGLATDQTYDFDADPSTPANTTNPDPYNENTLRQELGLPPRTSEF